MLASIENYYERLVLELIQERLTQTDETADADYLEDLACIALNKLPPRYVRHSVDLVSHLGDEEQEHLRHQAAAAVTEAIEVIARRRGARE